jgi:hypothetical protein
MREAARTGGVGCESSGQVSFGRRGIAGSKTAPRAIRHDDEP